MKTKVAIVILNWNGIGFLHKFLPILIENSRYPGADIIIADNASTDGSVEMLQNEFPDIQRIILDKNYGFAGGYNKALAQIDAEYFLLLNSDVEVTPNWLNPMMDFMESHPKVAACQPKILSYSIRNQFEHAGACGGFMDWLGYPYCRGRILAVCEEDQGQYNEIIPIFWATGASLLVRADVFNEAGGLDDAFFAHMEEIDLCWRIKSRGYEIVCVPQSVVYHVGGGTLNQESPRKTYLNFRNNLYLLYKNLPTQKFLLVFILRFILDYLAAFQLIITGKPENGKAVFKARRDFAKSHKDFDHLRKENLKKAVKTDISEILNKSIIYGYYFLNHKRYSDIH